MPPYTPHRNPGFGAKPRLIAALELCTKKEKKKKKPFPHTPYKEKEKKEEKPDPDPYPVRVCVRVRARTRVGSAWRSAIAEVSDRVDLPP